MTHASHKLQELERCHKITVEAKTEYDDNARVVIKGKEARELFNVMQMFVSGEWEIDKEEGK